jgi:uncharacterized protein YkwD
MKIKPALTVSFVLMVWGGNAAADAAKNTEIEAGFAAHLVRLVNQYRQQHSLPELVADKRLAGLADEHSRDMASKRHLSHDGFDERFDRANRTLCVENVGWNYRHAEGQLDGWRGSPDHNVNLLDAEIRRVGVAVSRRYVTFFACT